MNCDLSELFTILLILFSILIVNDVANFVGLSSVFAVVIQRDSLIFSKHTKRFVEITIIILQNIIMAINALYNLYSAISCRDHL